MGRIFPPRRLDPTAAKALGRIANSLQTSWLAMARPNQLPPPGNWRVWLLLAGRGFGKTRSGAEWVCEQVAAGRAKRVALVAPTAADARDVMVEGESGILAISPEWNLPAYEASKRRLKWPNGAIATTYSADEPERLRGPQHDAAWCDELAAWRYPEAWDQLMFGLRLGKNPQVVVTTTPKPVRLIRELLKRADVAVTRGSTRENAENLAPAFLDEIVGRYAGTRLGRQELDAELLDDVPGALWAREAIDRAHLSHAPALVRVVVAIDPAGSAHEGSDETGIIVAGMAGKEGYVLADLSGRYQPHDWARRAVEAFHSYKADRIIAETNFGGAMVESTLRAIDSSIPFKAVTASRGKVLRAEPIAAMYEQGRIHHIGSLPSLEDQMCGFSNDFDRAVAGYSPDRVDALVFALSELLASASAQGWIDFYDRMVARAHGLEPPYVPAISVDIQPMKVVFLAPYPFQSFAPARGKRYTSDCNCLIHDVDLDDIKGLEAAGCIPKNVVDR